MFLLISELGLKHNAFDKIEDLGKFIITHIETGFKYSIGASKHCYDNLESIYTTFAPGNPTVAFPRDRYANFEEIKKNFTNWVNNHLKGYIDELNEIDMWNQSSQLVETKTIEKIDFNDNSPFSKEEIIQIKLGLNEAKLVIINNFNLSENQIEIIENRFRYLEEAIDRTNKTDWKGIAISTVIGLVLNLGVDTNTGKAIWELFIKVFSNIPMIG